MQCHLLTNMGLEGCGMIVYLMIQVQVYMRQDPINSHMNIQTLRVWDPNVKWFIENINFKTGLQQEKR